MVPVFGGEKQNIFLRRELPPNIFKLRHADYLLTKKQMANIVGGNAPAGKKGKYAGFWEEHPDNRTPAHRLRKAISVTVGTAAAVAALYFSNKALGMDFLKVDDLEWLLSCAKDYAQSFRGAGMVGSIARVAIGTVAFSIIATVEAVIGVLAYTIGIVAARNPDAAPDPPA